MPKVYYVILAITAVLILPLIATDAPVELISKIVVVMSGVLLAALTVAKFKEIVAADRANRES